MATYRTYSNEWFEDLISWEIQVTNKYLLKKDYDRTREYAGYAEGTIKQARETMEKNPEMKSPKMEKFLEESLNEVKEILHRCPRQNANTTWDDRYTDERESYQEKNARWDYRESWRHHRFRKSLQQESCFNY